MWPFVVCAPARHAPASQAISLSQSDLTIAVTGQHHRPAVVSRDPADYLKARGIRGSSLPAGDDQVIVGSNPPAGRGRFISEN
jgi:hypothetical protein